MKIRDGFISNSSSCSFVVNKYYLSQEQIDKIYNHIEEGIRLGVENPMDMKWYFEQDFQPEMTEEEKEERCYRMSKVDAWSITEDENYLYGFTTMDNFDMKSFLIKIGVNLDNVEIND